MRRFRKVLIANRGEIAIRIIRTLRTLGVASAVVHHASERDAPAVREADDAWELSASSPVAAYLDGGQVIAAARALGADAIHPGYGFLSENADFAEAVGAAGLTFVGPPPAAIRLLGDKVRAREVATSCGVPVAPSALGGPDLAARVSREIGFPALVKAAAGGGGRGMRIVQSRPELEAAIAAAASEAERSFGDGRLYVERYVERPRHVEVQVLADAHGECLHLGERDCSIQRRFQKLVEESPAPALEAETRPRLWESAVTIARAAGYQNAGTVEFLLAPDGAFYFLEVNARLQVEHPVTEATTGLDLVELQLRVAAGEPIPLRQDDVHFQGHAIECRVCAEDPESGHAPTTGELAVLRPPIGPGFRFDAALVAGQTFTTAFDSMLAKVIAHGSDRARAIARARQALRELVLLGIVHNAAYLERVLGHPAFARAELHTDFLDEHRQDLGSEPADDVVPVLLAAAALVRPAAAAEIAEPYRTIGDWRN